MWDKVGEKKNKIPKPVIYSLMDFEDLWQDYTKESANKSKRGTTENAGICDTPDTNQYL